MACRWVSHRVPVDCPCGPWAAHGLPVGCPWCERELPMGCPGAVPVTADIFHRLQASFRKYGTVFFATTCRVPNKLLNTESFEHTRIQPDPAGGQTAHSQGRGPGNHPRKHGCPWGIHGSPAGAHMQTMGFLLGRCLWGVRGVPLACPWVAHGLSMGCPWAARGLTVDCSWAVHGLSVGRTWAVYHMGCP